MKTHALFAAGDEDGFAADDMGDLGGGSGNLRFIADRPVDRRCQFFAVGSDQRRAAIDAIVVPFRVDDNRLPQLSRLFNDGANNARAEGSLGIVGKNYRAGLGHRGFDARDHRRLAIRTCLRLGFPIGAHQMGRVVFGDETDLARGLPRVIDHEFGDDQSELGERVMQNLAGLVVTDQADENTLCAERCDIAGDVAGAADLDAVVFDLQNRCRRFRRNARNVAINEIVEHDVADTKNGLVADEPQGFFEVEHAVAPPALRSLTGSDRRDQESHSRTA